MIQTDPALDLDLLRSLAEMDVRPILSHELVVGDYLGVIAWCHGIAGPLILPAGDVHIWLDAPEDRRTSDEQDVYWGVLSGEDEPMFTFS